MSVIERFSTLLYSKKNLLIAVIVFFVLRIIYLFFFHNSINTAEDFTIAQNIAKGNGYSLVPLIGPTTIKTPVYPFILSLFIFVFGTFSKISIIIFQYVLASFIPFLLIEFCNSIKIEKAGYLAAWLFLLHPSYLYYPNVIEMTNIFIPLFIIFLILSIKTYNINNLGFLLLFGLISGIIILTQPIVSPVVFGILIYFLIKRKWKKAIISFLLICIVLTPWTIRNFNVFGKFIPTKSPFWLNFYVSYLPSNLVDNKFDILSVSDKRKIDSLYRIGKNDVEMEYYFKNIVKRVIADKPLLYLEKTFYQILAYWSIPPRYNSRNDIGFWIVRKIPIVIFNFLFVISIILTWRKNRNLNLIILSILLYFTIAYGLTTIVNIRFKLDIEWLELIPIGILIHKLFDKNKLPANLLDEENKLL